MGQTLNASARPHMEHLCNSSNDVALESLFMPMESFLSPDRAAMMLLKRSWLANLSFFHWGHSMWKLLNTGTSGFESCERHAQQFRPPRRMEELATAGGESMTYGEM